MGGASFGLRKSVRDYSTFIYRLEFREQGGSEARGDERLINGTQRRQPQGLARGENGESEGSGFTMCVSVSVGLFNYYYHQGRSVDFRRLCGALRLRRQLMDIEIYIRDRRWGGQYLYAFS